METLSPCATRFDHKTPAQIRAVLEKAVRDFIVEHDLDYSPCMDDVGADGFVAYGVRHGDNDNAWAARVVARPSPEGDAVEFQAAALFKVCGEDWYLNGNIDHPTKHFPARPTWTESIDENGARSTTFDPEILTAFAHTFTKNRDIRIQVKASERDAESLRERLGADSRGVVTVPGGMCYIGTHGTVASADFKFSLTDPVKIAAVLEALNGSAPERSNRPRL